jgi:hypothetical protein
MQATFAAERNARAAHAIAVLLEEAALARENGEALSLNLDRSLESALQTAVVELLRPVA